MAIVNCCCFVFPSFFPTGFSTKLVSLRPWGFLIIARTRWGRRAAAAQQGGGGPEGTPGHWGSAAQHDLRPSRFRSRASMRLERKTHVRLALRFAHGRDWNLGCLA